MIYGQHSRLKKVRFYNSVVLVNAATLFLLVAVFQPSWLPRKQAAEVVYAAPAPTVFESQKLPVSGKPVRIEIIQEQNGMHIDLPVREGHYDANKQSWTLNQQDAFYAMPSMIANDTLGTTIIYGHNEAHIFGHLSALRQGVGAYALVYTENGHVFRYSYTDGATVKPHDVSMFRNDGPPTLLLQTCSGNWFELRRMYQFSFEKVEL